MREFILKSLPISNRPPRPEDACRICKMVGMENEISHYIELGRPNGIAIGKGWEISCAQHIRYAINDVLAEASVDWRIRADPAERIESDAVHATAADLLKLCTLLRQPGRRLDVADRIRSLALQVHKAARYLERYENATQEAKAPDPCSECQGAGFVSSSILSPFYCFCPACTDWGAKTQNENMYGGNENE